MPKLSQKGIPPILIVILLAAALAGGFLVYRQQPKNLSQPQQTTQPSPTSADETANWKIYTNSKNGFEVKYPNEFKEKQKITNLAYGGINLTSLFTAKDQYSLEANSLDIHVYPSLKDYRLVDNYGGFIFYFDVNNKKWLHDKTNNTSEFVPKRADSSIEAYIYKTGDAKCSAELILIPNPSFTYLVEIINGLCRDDEGNYLDGYYDLKSDQILSTFKFTQ